MNRCKLLHETVVKILLKFLKFRLKTIFSLFNLVLSEADSWISTAKNWVFATSSIFLSLYLCNWMSKPLICQTLIILSYIIQSLKYLRSTTLGCKDCRPERLKSFVFWNKYDWCILNMFSWHIFRVEAVTNLKNPCDISH